MKINIIKHNTEIIVGDYQFADKVKEQVLSLLKVSRPISKDSTNVKAWHSEWDWHPNNITFRNLKSFIREQIEGYYEPGRVMAGGKFHLGTMNFWANVYSKGDYARRHNHYGDFSFLYFVKGKWFHSPLVFSDTGKRIRPKEGRYVIFPAYMYHHVPTHRYNDTRMTISGNFQLEDMV